MYKSFRIVNFKCFSDIAINDLKRINLVTGKNNVGKTALLEAIFLHCGAYKPELVFNTYALRGMGKMSIELGGLSESIFDSLFSDFNITKRIELKGSLKVTGKRELNLKTVKEADELREIRNYIAHDDKIIDKELKEQIFSPESAQIIELEFKEGKKLRKYHLIMDKSGRRTIPIPPRPPFPAIFISSRHSVISKEEIKRFDNLVKSRRQDLLIEILKIVEPKLSNITIGLFGEDPMLFGDIGLNRLIPFPLMGAGIVRLNSLVLAITSAENGVVLFDEIENGIHHSVMPIIWKGVERAAREYNTQVFATTHSFECITSAHNAFKETGTDDFNLIRLEKIDGKIEAISYNQKTLDAAIDIGIEVR